MPARARTPIPYPSRTFSRFLIADDRSARQHGSMTINRTIRMACTALSAAVLTTGGMLHANRLVPEWQGFSKRPLGATAGCAMRVLDRYGHVVRERGAKPEAGSIRLILYPMKNSGRSAPLLTAYFDGDATFTSAFMDAADRHTAGKVWQGFRQQCRLSEGR